MDIKKMKEQNEDMDRLRTHPKKIEDMTKEERILTARIISSNSII